MHQPFNVDQRVQVSWKNERYSILAENEAFHERGTNEKSEFPTGFEPITSQTPGGRSIHLSYGELMESEAILYTRFIFDTRPNLNA